MDTGFSWSEEAMISLTLKNWIRKNKYLEKKFKMEVGILEKAL